MGQTLSEPVVDKVIASQCWPPAPAPALLARSTGQQSPALSCKIAQIASCTDTMLTR
jgi:hypothetical protein